MERGMEVNVVRTKSAYKFKNLECNSETVFTGHVNVKLYVSQSCERCNYSSIGYYKYIREPQHFECVKCKHEWGICCIDGKDSKMDSLEKELYNLDKSISSLKAMVLV
jgi:hypothetical protein